MRADLRHFEGMGDPGAIQVALVIHEHLGLVDQPPKRVRVDDAIAISLELGAETAAVARESDRPRLCSSIAA